MIFLKRHLFLSFFPHKITDNEGRVIASVGPLEEGMEGPIALQISQNMHFESSLLKEL